MNKLLHAFIRKGEKSKRSTSPLWREMLFLLVLFTTLGSMDLKAQTITIDGSTTDWNFANFSLNPVKVYKPDAHGNGVVDDQFTTGSKDFFFASAIEWEIGQTKGKNDIANAAAVISNGILYFAGDRSTNEGDAQIGFWLYLNGTGPRVLKTSPKVGGDFFPEHRIGDLFILSDFTGGGRTGTVSVYRWVGTGGNVVGSNGTLNTTSIVGNVAENNKDQDGDISTVPTGWFLKDKDGNATAEYEQNQFFEGQVLLNGEDFDLDDVDLCQASILIETRSSQSITASLDDFVGGSFNITPTVTVNSPTVCASALPTTITATPGDGTPNQFNYTWAVPPAYVGNPGNVQSFQTSVAGTYTVTITRKGLECPSAPASGVLTIKPTSSSIQNRTICSNQLPYTWDGQTFTAAGQKVKTGLTNAAGCDSTATYNLTVNLTSSSIQNRTICSNQLPYTWDGQTFTAAGQKVKTGLTNAAGCDSTATYNLTVNLTSSSIQNRTICSNQLPYTWDGQTFTAAGQKVKTGLTNAAGCDSTATYNLTVNLTSSSIQNRTICSNQLPYTWDGQTFTAAGQKVKTGLTNAAGCDSTATYNLTVNLTSSSIQNRTICSNQLPYTWDGQTFTAAGQKVKTGLTNAVGCDSTATYNLTVNPLPIISCSATPTLIDITSAAHNTQMNVDLSLNADTDPTHYTYAWTEDGAGSFNFNNIKNPVYTAGVLDAGQVISFTVTVTNKLTGCVSESKCSVTVNSAGSCPGVPTSEVCNGSTNTYTADRAATANETWKWTVNNGASIVGADNGQSVTVTAGSQAFTLTLTVSYANTELSPTTCKYEVATTPCGGYCTYTQGKYGNKSPACDGDGNGDGTPITYPSVVEMIKAMLGVGGVANPLYIGGDGITKPRVTIPATATAAVLLNASMPGGSTARELIGNCTVDNAGGLPACWTASTNTLTSYLTKQGKINNVFLSQTIALGLNMRVSGGLGGFALQAGTFATAKAVGGCGSTTALQRSCYLNELGQLVVVNEYVYKTIGQDIINALTCKGYPLTVAGLYQLANDGLANADGVVGSECGASLSSISGAAASINEGFDECRIAIGWNVGPCEIPTRRININTSGVITSPDLNAQMVDAIRVSAYPNPFAEKVSFVIVSPVSGKASLEVYNMFGQKLQTVFEGYMTAGRNQFVEYRPGTNAAGTLIYKFSIDGKQVTGKLINLKQ